jgi:hypothetical protein
MTGFPDTFRRHPRDLLLRAYGEGPRRLRDAVAGLTPDELMARPDPERWSVAEIVHHVADAELVGACRFRRALSEPGGVLAEYDPDRWATALGYGDRPVEELDAALDGVEAARGLTARLLDRAPESAWSETSRHGEWGELTLRQILELYADHVERHVVRIDQIRGALGRPRSGAGGPLFPEPLYPLPASSEEAGRMEEAGR